MYKKMRRWHSGKSIIEVICIVCELFLIAYVIKQFGVIPYGVSVIVAILAGISLWMSFVDLIKDSIMLLLADFEERVKELSDAASENKE